MLMVVCCRHKTEATLAPLEIVELGRSVFQENCSSCHSLTGESGARPGPSLATARKSRDATAIRESIIEPDRTVVPGYPPMPDSFQHLSERELDAVVYFVANEVKP